MNAIFVMLLAVTILVCCISEHLSIRYGILNKNAVFSNTIGLIKCVWSLAAIIWGPPLPVFFLVYGALIAFQSMHGAQDHYLYHIFYLMSFISFACTLLFWTGVISFAGSFGFREMFGDAYMRAYLILATCFTQGLLMLVFRWLNTDIVHNIGYDRKQDRLFLFFLYSCEFYIYVDTAFCLLHTGWVAAVLLIVGNVLILLLVFLISHQRWKLTQKRFLEEEHARLFAERAQEQLRRERLQRSVEHDRLTGCFSRRYILDQIEEQLTAHALFSVAFIDMDGLKRINDTQGHQAGDELLMRFAKELREQLRHEDLLGRLGGDEFLILLPGCGSDAAQARIQNIRACLSAQPAPISFSFGIASSEHNDIQALLRRADEAMYYDKCHMRERR